MPKGKLTVCSPTATAISFTASGSRVQRQTDRCIIHGAGACVLFHHHVFRSAVYTCLCQTYELGLSRRMVILRLPFRSFGSFAIFAMLSFNLLSLLTSFFTELYDKADVYTQRPQTSGLLVS